MKNRALPAIALHNPLANDRVLAQEWGEAAQELLRAGRPMIFSPSGKHVNELAYGLGDQFRALLVEQPHRTNSTFRDERHFPQVGS
jgi:hypothetical protein